MDEASASAEIRRFLRKHGLPERLLPESEVRQATHDPATGRFEVVLGRVVDRDVGGIPVRYAERITGRLAAGEVADLSGIRAKKVIWVSVGAMRVVGDRMVFSVGPIEKRLPRALFE